MNDNIFNSSVENHDDDEESFINYNDLYDLKELPTNDHELRSRLPIYSSDATQSSQRKKSIRKELILPTDSKRLSYDDTSLNLVLNFY